MTKRTTTLATPGIVIASASEFRAKLDEVATLGVELDKLNADKEEAAQKVLLDHDSKIEEKAKQIDEITKACELYASTRRDELFPKGKKSAQTSLTTYGYRLGQPSLKTAKGWNFDKVVALFKKTKRKAYIIVKESLDKDAVRLHVKPGKLARLGLKVEQKETFYIERKTEE